MEDHPSLEDALAAMERRAENAAHSTSRLLAALKRAQQSARSGDLAALKKAVAEQMDLLRAADADAKDLSRAWPYSDDEERRVLEDGRFLREVVETATRQGVTITEQDGLLLSYPVIVRLDPTRRAVTINRKLDRRIRPTFLVKQLAALQQRPIKFKPAQFIESLYSAWEYARRRVGVDQLFASDVKVNDLWTVFTVAPGSAAEYPRQEFGRDLYLLEGSEVRETRTGAHIHFSRSTGTKQPGAIVVVGEDGRRVTYSSISFTLS
ncbi:MAG: hypothetical protein M0038_09795 [Pseudomonadota bacterium]|nr:hypothetical protein [Pseudomonadota bacterium]